MDSSGLASSAHDIPRTGAIFPTLAFQLAYRYPLFRKELLLVLKANPDAGRELFRHRWKNSSFVCSRGFVTGFLGEIDPWLYKDTFAYPPNR